MATLRESDTSDIDTTLSPKTTRQIVKRGDATVTTPGATGFEVVDLVDGARDTIYLAANSGAPVLLGVDDVLLLPLQFPEAA